MVTATMHWLYVHVKQSVLWDQASIVTREDHWTKRKIKEGIVIRERTNLNKGLNRPAVVLCVCVCVPAHYDNL